MILAFLFFFLIASVADVIHVNRKLDSTINPTWRR